MFIWLVTGHLVGYGLITVPCITKELSLSEVEEHIKSDSIYKSMTVRKVEAVGGTNGGPGMGLWIANRDLGK